MRLLGVLLLAAGVTLGSTALLAPRPLVALVGLGLLVAGYVVLEEGNDRAARRRRERERPGYVHRRP